MSELVKKAAAVSLIIIAAAGVFSAPVSREMPKSRSFSGKGRTWSIKAHDSVQMDLKDVFNSGDEAALQRIPGIGEVLAVRIIQERTNNGPFIFPEDILSVNGIGQRKLEQYRPIMRMGDWESRE